MRNAQTFIGLLITLFGAFLLLVTAGGLSLSSIDIAAVALILSGLLFWIPGIAWRHTVPWVAFLFIPGSLAFAVGAILLYTARASASEWLYLWAFLPVAVGVAFLAIYDLALHAHWAWLVGIVVIGVGLALLGFGMALFGATAITRTVGAIVLIAVGALVALRAAVPRRT
jgi:hypothetical protein